MLQERQKSILNAVIREYVRTAKPVASKELAEGQEEGLSSATIRSEMLHLDQLGYLAQPHTSSGRIPTDKGYRFFVDYLLREQDTLPPREEASLERVFAHEGEEEFIRELGKTVARLSKMLTATSAFDEGFFYETGFSEVLGEPEFADREAVRNFGELADFLGEEMDEMAYDFEDAEEQILIGAENPWERARNYSMIITSWRHPRGFRGSLAMIGPKRTNYPRHKAIIRSIRAKMRGK